MKKFRIVFSALLLFLVCSAFTMGGGKKQVYAFGVSASFVDTVVYYTDIQVLDSVQLDKNSFLKGRELYSYQLKNYLENNKSLSNRTCMIYFSEDKKKLSKELNKLVSKYKKDKKTSVQLINSEDFKFTKPEE